MVAFAAGNAVLAGGYRDNAILGLRTPVSEATIRFTAHYSGLYDFNYLLKFSNKAQLQDATGSDDTTLNFGGNNIAAYPQTYDLTIRGSAITLSKDGTVIGSATLDGVRWLYFNQGNEARALHIEDFEINGQQPGFYPGLLGGPTLSRVVDLP